MMKSNSPIILLLLHIFSVFDAFPMHKEFSKLEKVLEEKAKKQQLKMKESKKEEEFDAEQIVKALKEENIISEDASISNIKRTLFRDIIFLKEKDDEKVIKVTDAEEHKVLIKELNLVQFIQKVRQNNKDVPLPIIIEPRGGLMIGGKIALAFDKAQGISLSDLLEKKLKSMNDQSIKETFLNIGRQIGNLDRLLYEQKGGIVCHPDSHGGNFFYDEKNKQFYWIDTKGINIQYGIKSSLLAVKSCLRWFEEIHQDWVKQIQSRLRSLFNQLYAEINIDINNDFEKTKKVEKELGSLISVSGSKISLKPNIIEVDALKFFSKLAEKQQKRYIRYFKDVIQQLQKCLLVLKSFGEGYVEGNPEGKEAFNKAIRMNQEWNKITEQIIKISEILHLDQNKFADPMQK